MPRLQNQQTIGAMKMQASKIKIGETYAIKHDDKLTMFRVTAVTTRRTGSTPHDFSHKIEGVLSGPKHPIELHEGISPKSAVLTLQPDAILGPYTDYLELVEQQKRKNEAKQAETKRELDDVETLLKYFCEITGQEYLPPKHDRYHFRTVPFRPSYSGIDIGREGVVLLLKALKLPVADSRAKELSE